MWKRDITTTVSALLLLLPLSVAAQTEPAGQQEPRAAQERQDVQRAEMGPVVRADRLIGQAVRDRQDERVGRINDLVLDVNENRIAYAVIAHGGVFGIGAEHRAMEWNQIQPDPARGIVRLDATRQQLEQAERVDPGGPWPLDIGRDDRPVGTTGPDARPEARPEARQDRLGVSNIIGMDVHDQAGERIGQIDDLAVKRDGTVSYAVIAHGGFLGFGHDYVAVPWERMDLDARQERLTLNVTGEQLEAARPFPRDERWPETVQWPFGETR